MNADPDVPVFFSIRHIIKAHQVKLIYGVRFEGRDYFLFKTLGLNDCEQVDGNPTLEQEPFDTMCEVITAIENEYKRIPPLEFINLDIHSFLVRVKNPRYAEYVRKKKQ